MAIIVPKDGDIISAGTFGVPVANEINRITPIATVTPWVNFGLGAGWVVVVNAFFSYRKIGDNVQLRGVVANNGTGLNTIIGTLPVGYRPAQAVYPISSSYNGSTWIPVTLYIEPSSGFIWYHSGNTNAPSPNYLNIDMIFSTTA